MTEGEKKQTQENRRFYIFLCVFPFIKGTDTTKSFEHVVIVIKDAMMT